jgi:hypothetical protein
MRSVSRLGGPPAVSSSDPAATAAPVFHLALPVTRSTVATVGAIGAGRERTHHTIPTAAARTAAARESHDREGLPRFSPVP